MRLGQKIANAWWAWQHLDASLENAWHEGRAQGYEDCLRDSNQNAPLVQELTDQDEYDDLSDWGF